jgi:hypothetical protein
MALSVRTRFEVFKRDRFTCRYCGRTTPDVLLEVDHLIPRAAGGSDDLENLVTACWDCNHGKADRLLDESSAAPVSLATVEATEERVEQARAYAAAVQAERELHEQFRWMVVEAWGHVFGAVRKETETGTLLEFEYAYGRFPNDGSIRRILRRLPVAQVLEAVDITSARFRSASRGAESYFFGVCWRMVDQIDNRT